MYAFLQCENRMWRVSEQRMPNGIQIGGGSDWFCLNHQFIDYLVNSKDKLLLSLKQLYANILLPSEVFIQSLFTVIIFNLYYNIITHFF
jgi:protein xylosyltransferase